MKAFYVTSQWTIEEVNLPKEALNQRLNDGWGYYASAKDAIEAEVLSASQRWSMAAEEYRDARENLRKVREWASRQR